MLHQLGQEREPVHARHLDIQRQHVGAELRDLLARHVGVHRAPDHLDVGALRELLRQHLPHDRRVVDDKDADHVGDLPQRVLLQPSLQRLDTAQHVGREAREDLPVDADDQRAALGSVGPHSNRAGRRRRTLLLRGLHIREEEAQLLKSRNRCPPQGRFQQVGPPPLSWTPR